MNNHLQIKPFPLEAEATARMAQYELTKCSKEELLLYAQQTVLVMSQLRHYTSELIALIEGMGYTVSAEVKNTESKG